VGHEYGATTRRPRRIGWLDLPLLRYSMSFTGENVILTRLDILDGMDAIKICVAYRYVGEDYVRGERTIKKGDSISVAVPDLQVMEHCEPIYVKLPGWHQPIRSIRAWSDLPKACRNAIEFVRQETEANVTLLSVGPNRDETIVMNVTAISSPQL
jgi:adenylosuccinate synthase